MNPLSTFVSDLHLNDRGDREISKISAEIFALFVILRSFFDCKEEEKNKYNYGNEILKRIKKPKIFTLLSAIV